MKCECKNLEHHEYITPIITLSKCKNCGKIFISGAITVQELSQFKIIIRRIENYTESGRDRLKELKTKLIEYLDLSRSDLYKAHQKAEAALLQYIDNDSVNMVYKKIKEG
jgi:hypothetical protein